MPSAARYAKEKAALAAIGQTPYGVRKTKGLANNFRVAQTRGHARPKLHERSVSHVKRIAKEQNIPMGSVQRVTPGTPGKTEGDFRSKRFTGAQYDRALSFIHSLPYRTRVMVKARGMGTGTPAYPAKIVTRTIVTNRHKILIETLDHTRSGSG